MSAYTQYAKSAKLGVGLLVGALLVSYLLFHKDVIGTWLMSGKTINATFQDDYKLRADVSVVKVGYVKVGKVSGIERNSDGTAKVSMKVDEDVLETLGSEPTATIRSTTILGGNYFVDLAKGGEDGEFKGDSIPLARTGEPVELDKVARALQPDALKGAQKTLGEVNQTFDKDGQKALRRFMESAPGTLKPAARVLNAAQGDSPEDLSHVVGGLESASTALTRTQGQLDSILANMHKTTSVLSQHRSDIADTIAEMPTSMTTARTGLEDLSGTLGTLRDTAGDIEPVVEQLDKSLEAINPVLTNARPVIADGRAVLTDARPVLAGLVPSAKTASKVFDDLDGAVLDRLNGPVTKWLYDPYKGTGPYALTSSDKPMYEEIVYMFTTLNRASSYADRNGNAVSFQPGIGTGSVGGMPVSLEQLFKGLTTWLYPNAPKNTLAPINRPTTPSKPGKPGANPTTPLVGSLNQLLGGLLGGGK